MKATSQNTFWRRLAGPALVTASMLVSSAVSATTLNGAYWNWFDLVGGAPGGYVSGGVWADLQRHRFHNWRSGLSSGEYLLCAKTTLTVAMRVALLIGVTTKSG